MLLHRRSALVALILVAGCSTHHTGPVPPGEGEEDLAMSGGDDGSPPDDNPDLSRPPGKGDLAMPGGDGGGDMAMQGNPGSCNQAIVIKPADQLVYTDGVHTFQVTYKLFCGAFDMAANATWSVDDGTLGGFGGNVFTTAVAGKGTSTIRATLGMQKASTSITVKPTSVVIGPNTPMDAPTKFGGQNDPNRAPQWVYPADGVLVPPNLSELEFHFTPQGNTLFELGFAGAGLNLKVYTVCNAAGNGCAFELDEPTWVLLSTVARGQTVTVTVRGTSMNGGPVGTSAARKISFSDEDVTGGLYYWAASSGSVNRYDFGLRGQKGEVFLAGNQFNCAGCHALSLNGTRIAVGWGIPGMQMQVLDVATKQPLYNQGGFIGASTFEAFSPDGSKVITSEGNKLTLRDSVTGAAVGNTVTQATMPDFSADGAHVTYAHSPQSPPISSPGIGGAGINIIDLANNNFGQPRVLVAPTNGQDNYYPSFSPDGGWVVFNRSIDKPDPMNNNQVTSSSYDQPDARVMFVSSAGGAAIDSASVNAIAGNSWPKWAPFTHHFNGSTIFWLTFSTRRPYGLRGGTAAQLWMVAVDPGKLGNKQDGAYPAFRLPFQDFSTGNHIAQWAQKVVRKPCSIAQGGGCGQNEVCVGGFCQPQP